MSYYTDKVSGAKIRYYDVYKLLDKTDFSGATEDCLRIRYNFDVRRGMLVDGVGIEPHDFFGGRNMQIIHFFRCEDVENNVNRDQMVGITSDGKFVYYFVNDPDMVVHEVENMSFPPDVNFINYKFLDIDYLVINSNLGGYHVWNGESMRTVDENPMISRIAIYDDYLFACSKNNFSSIKRAPLSSPNGWSSDMVSMRLFNECGACLVPATIKTYLYVFQEYGISRISRIDGLTGSYDISKIWYAGEKIMPDSVTVCGDDIYFCTNAGAYCFNGTSVSRVLTELDGFIVADEHSKACFFNGKLYLATKAEIYDEPFGAETNPYSQNNALIIYDTTTKKSEVMRGISVSSFCPVPSHNSLLVSINESAVGLLTKTGVWQGEPLYKCLETNPSSFGTGNKKNLLGMRIKNNVPLELRVFVDGEEHYFDVPAGEMRVFRIGLSGYRLSFSLKSVVGSCIISVPVLLYSEEVS